MLVERCGDLRHVGIFQATPIDDGGYPLTDELRVNAARAMVEI